MTRILRSVFGLFSLFLGLGLDGDLGPATDPDGLDEDKGPHMDPTARSPPAGSHPPLAERACS
jgi:hypothetical protein